MAKERILIAEDHAILREGLRLLLSMNSDLEIVGEVEDGRSAIHCAKLLKPTVIIMDLSMPYTNGTEAINIIKSRFPETKIIVLTVHKTEEYVKTALNSGASGYVLKDDTHEELLRAIKSVTSGKKYLSPGVCDQIISTYLKQTSPLKSLCSWGTLSTREREIIKLIAEGKKNKEIASYLSISVKTVEKHRSNLMKKLDLHNSSELTAYAIENKLTCS